MAHIIGQLTTDTTESCLLTGKQYMTVKGGGLTIDCLGSSYIYSIFQLYALSKLSKLSLINFVLITGNNNWLFLMIKRNTTCVSFSIVYDTL